MKRFLAVLAFMCLLSVSALAGDIPMSDFAPPVPGDIQMPGVASPAPGDMPTSGSPAEADVVDSMILTMLGLLPL